MSKKKTGLMYSGNFAEYKAGDGYLCMPAGYNPLIATNDYYETPERVREAYEILRKSGAWSTILISLLTMPVKNMA